VSKVAQSCLKFKLTQRCSTLLATLLDAARHT
jgi:hypothetical protein